MAAEIWRNRKATPATLADMCAAQYHVVPEWRPIIKDVVEARKFVLDKDMSAYLAELSRSFWRGGLRKRQHALDNARQMARLPHRLTWVECDWPAYMNYLRRKYKLTIQYSHSTRKDFGPPWVEKEAKPSDPLPFDTPKRMGWLLRQHPNNDAAFQAIEIRQSVVVDDMGFIFPLSIAWSADDSPIPWKRFPVWDSLASDVMTIVMMDGYKTTQTYYIPAFDAADTTRMLSAMDKKAVKLMATGRDLWGLLATINDLPLTRELVYPSTGRIVRGSFKKYMKHTIVHLDVPTTRWRQLVARVATLLRKRAHQVRGHWRKNWRRPLSPFCEHQFDEDLICRLCHGHKIWVKEHQRGSAGIGFVTHDYNVHHDPKATS